MRGENVVRDRKGERECVTHLLQLLHIFGLDVHNVEALVVDAEIPKVDAQVIGGDECLIVTGENEGRKKKKSVK
jgi:hypothetical protein